MKIILAAALMLGGMTAANAQTPQPADWTILNVYRRHQQAGRCHLGPHRRS